MQILVATWLLQMNKLRSLKIITVVGNSAS